MAGVSFDSVLHSRTRSHRRVADDDVSDQFHVFGLETAIGLL